MHRWTSTVEEERVCLHRCVIDRRVYAASLSVAAACYPPDACDRELGHVLGLTHMHVTLLCDRKRRRIEALLGCIGLVHDRSISRGSFDIVRRKIGF